MANKYEELLAQNKSVLDMMDRIEKSRWRKFKAWLGRLWDKICRRKPKGPTGTFRDH